MVVRWRALLLIAVTSLFVFEEWVSTPTCNFTPSIIDVDDGDGDFVEFGEHHDDLKVMMVADLLLSGPDSGFLDRFFRDYYMSKFFRKSFESLKPDLLLVLGDVSAKGSELTKSKWISVLHQFFRVLGPFAGLPFHAILGDRDIGECSDLDVKKVDWIASKLPGLDPSGCGAFEIGNISFVSLNAVALLCGNNHLRFDVEKVIERESVEVRLETEDATEAINDTSRTKVRHADFNFGWRESTMLSGSGPVLLLHFPLSQARNEPYDGINALKRTSNSSKDESNVREIRELIGDGPYNLFHTLPANATEYVFQALKPRIIFSAHRHAFTETIHLDRIREVTVPTMSWNARDDPGFVVATFQKRGRVVSISYCSLARESHIILLYISTLLLFCLICLKG